MPQNVEYTSKYILCKNFAAAGTCSRPSCGYSHTILDTARLHALVGDIPRTRTVSQPETAHSPSEKTYFLIEYVKYSAGDSEAVDPDCAKWRMRLLGGGRATLSSGGTGGAPLESISVQPTYPVKVQGAEAGVALVALEGRVFGRSPQPDHTRSTICKSTLEEVCRRENCKYSHTLFDMRRVEALLDAAVRERGYRDFRPLVEMEYVGKPDAKGGVVRCAWRVTLRCVVSYQNSAPQPVVVTSTDLNTAMRLLETQFAGSSGKPQAIPRKPSTPSSRGRGGRGSGRRSDHSRQQSSASAHSTSSTGPVAFTAQPAGPPPSYTDAMGHMPPPSRPDAKIRR